MLSLDQTEWTHQVIIGELYDLMLQARVDSGVFRQKEALSQQLLLLLLLQLVHILEKIQALLTVNMLLLLQLTLQEPGGGTVFGEMKLLELT